LQLQTETHHDFSFLQAYGHPIRTPLAEVFSVIIEHDVEECQLYGTILIAVDDDNGALNIYHVGPGRCKDHLLSSERTSIQHRPCNLSHLSLPWAF